MFSMSTLAFTYMEHRCVVFYSERQRNLSPWCFLDMCFQECYYNKDDQPRNNFIQACTEWKTKFFPFSILSLLYYGIMVLLKGNLGKSVFNFRAISGNFAMVRFYRKAFWKNLQSFYVCHSSWTCIWWWPSGFHRWYNILSLHSCFSCSSESINSWYWPDQSHLYQRKNIETASD